jgi:hypothetical protein
MDDANLIDFKNSIIMPCGKNQLGHMDQLKTIKHG